MFAIVCLFRGARQEGGAPWPGPIKRSAREYRRGDYGVEVPVTLTPEKAVNPRIMTYQSPAAGLVSVHVSELPVMNGRQLKVVVVGFAPNRT